MHRSVQLRPDSHEPETLLKALGDMDLSTQPQRLPHVRKRPPLTSTTICTLLLGLALLTISTQAGCSAEGEVGGGPIITNAPSSGSGGAAGGGGIAGTATVSLAWDPVTDAGVVGYFVYYGTESANLPGSCAYQQSTFSSSPAATVTGLAPNTTYFFAVTAYNGLESPCSEEVSTVTPSV